MAIRQRLSADDVPKILSKYLLLFCHGNINSTQKKTKNAQTDSVKKSQRVNQESTIILGDGRSTVDEPWQDRGGPTVGKYDQRLSVKTVFHQ